MRSTRLTQPYRRSGSRVPSPVLDAMRKGRTLGNDYNPMDLQRSVQRLMRAGKRRPRRPGRPGRPPRA